MAVPTLPRIARAGLVAVLLAGTTLGGWAARADTTTPPPGTIQPAPAAHALPDFSDLAAQVSPAVVSITVHEHATPNAMGEREAQEARASGFIIDTDGTIVTNNHVVKDADQVTVTLSDGTELPARVVGRDARTDLAVLHVDAGHPLPALQLGDSDQVRPGQWVIAVGNPFGLGGTVTAGIVSARGRDIGAGPYDAFLQVDAAINKGNSGGPLFTQDGRVVGVNTAIYSPTGGSVGIGFAIPSSLVRDVVGQLRATGHVTRGFLGVQTQPVTAAIAPGLGLQADARGVLVAAVAPDSPAARAGVQPGDVLQAVDGHAVATPRELAAFVANLQPGADAKITLLRDGQPRTLDAHLAAMPDDRRAANDVPPGRERDAIGLALAPLSPEAREQLELPDGQTGVVVAGVRPASAAARAGLREGDILVGVGARPVTAPSEAVAAIREAARDGHDVALRIVRNGQARFVAVSPNAQG